MKLFLLKETREYCLTGGNAQASIKLVTHNKKNEVVRSLRNMNGEILNAARIVDVKTSKCYELSICYIKNCRKAQK